MDQTIKLRIQSKEKLSKDTARLYLEPVSKRIHFQAGQFLTFLFDELATQEVRRSYSICSKPSEQDKLAIAVKKVSNGLVSRYLVDQTQVGEVLTALAPAGQFVLPSDWSESAPLVLVGGGSGMSPLFSLLQGCLEKDQRPIYLLLANSNEQRILFLNELNELATRFQNRFHCFHLLSNPMEQPSDLKARYPNMEFKWGRLSNFLFEEFIKKRLGDQMYNAHYYLCGPELMILKAQTVLRTEKVSIAHIHREIFTVKTPLKPNLEELENAQIEINYLGEKMEFPLTAGQTVLEAALEASYDLPYNCRAGTCTICVGTCTEGNAQMYTQEQKLDTDMTKGAIFTCVAYPTTKKLKLSIP